MLMLISVGDAVATLALMVRAVTMVAATDAIFCACLGMDCCLLETENAEAEPMAESARIIEVFMVILIDVYGCIVRSIEGTVAVVQQRYDDDLMMCQVM